MAVEDRDLGYARVMRNLRKVTGRNPAVFVGVHADAGKHPDGAPLVQIAAVNEFGSQDGVIPERSYLRSTIDAKRGAYLGALSRIAADIADPRTVDARARLRRDLGRLGLQAVGDVQQTMTDLRDPPNAPSTVYKKGSDNPLIDTGRLRQSIAHEVRGA